MPHKKILADLKQKKYAPVYIFEGEEPYFIDLLSDYISEHVLDDAEKEFNQSILYGQDVKPEDLAPIVKRYPMMAEHQVVIVREAQVWRNFDALEHFIKNPVTSTILVINYRGKKLDGRSTLAKLIKSKKHNVVSLSSPKLRENEVAAWINQYCKSKNLEIDPRAVGMLAENIGNNLGNLVDALDKLIIVVPKGQTISPDDVSKHIGISKDFNIFELQKAIGQRNDYRSLFIANYFANNQKDHHVIPVTGGLYRFFRQLLIYHSLVKSTDKNALASAMGVSPYFLNDYITASRNYGPYQVINVIDILHDIDLKSKGVNITGMDSGVLLKEMVSRILRV